MHEQEMQANPIKIALGIGIGYLVLTVCALYGGHALQMRRIRRKRESAKRA